MVRIIWQSPYSGEILKAAYKTDRKYRKKRMVINENIYLKEEQDWWEHKLLAKDDSEFTTEKKNYVFVNEYEYLRMSTNPSSECQLLKDSNFESLRNTVLWKWCFPK